MFGDLVEAILNNNNDKDLSENVSENESKNVSENKSENVNENESENENDDDDEFYELKQLNKYFKTIDQTKWLEKQIELLKEREFLDEYWHMENLHGAKKLNLKIFKVKVAYILNYLYKELF